MKYPSSLLGVIAFTAAMTWTWNVIHAESAVSFETHSGIQDRLASLIEESIREKLPSATEITIDRVWTEVIASDKIKASFIYSFRDKGDSGAINTTIKGEGVLERQAADATGLDKWALTKVHTTNDIVVFEDGLVVTPGEEKPPEQ